MSTEYAIHENLTVLEHSNMFNIYAETTSDQDTPVVVTRDCSLDELKVIVQNLVNVVSYFDFDYSGCKVSY